MKNVRFLADRTNDNKHITPELALLDAMNEIRSGKKVCDKLIILTLDTREDAYNVGFYSSNIKGSEIIALCTRFAHIMNGRMDDWEK